MVSLVLLGNIVLATISVVGLLVIPFGLPGLVIMAVSLIVYEWVLAGQQFTIISLAFVITLASLSELFDYWLTVRLTKRAGASHKASWGALIGGITGAIIGVPIPIIGSVIGSLLGLFAGAYIAERSGGSHQKAARIGWAALASRLTSTAIKFAIGIGVLVWIILTVF